MKFLLLISCFATLACAAGKTVKSEAIPDGMSLETAVMIQVERQSDSPAAEWAWIVKNLPGASRPEAKPVTTTEEGDEIVTFAHALLEKHGRIYSALLVSQPDGTERTVYFDITSCFGK